MTDMDRSEVAGLLRKHAAPTHPGTGTGQEVHDPKRRGESTGEGTRAPGEAGKFSAFVHVSDDKMTTRVDNRNIEENYEPSGDITMRDLPGGLSVPSYLASPKLGRPDLPEGEFWVLTSKRDELDRKVARLGRKAERLGYDPLRLTPTGRTHIWEDTAGYMGGRVVEFQSYKLEGEPPLIPGFEFAAKIEHIEGPDGKYINLLKKNPNYEGDIPKKYRDAGPNCDACKRKIYRRDTFVVHNTKTDEWVQLGRDDLRTYTGADDIESVVEYDSLFMEDMGRFGEPDDDFFGGGGSGEQTVGTRTFLAYSVAAIEKDGRYVKTRGDKGMPTRDHVLEALNPRNKDITLDVTDAHYAKADQIMEWLDEVEPGDSDYLWNLKVAAQHTAIDRRMFGLVASAPSAHRREVERSLMLDSLDESVDEGPSFTSEFVGSPKERLKGLELAVTRTHSFETQYGTTFIYNMRDDSGNSYVWFSSNGLTKVDTAAAEKARQESIEWLKEGERLFKEKLEPAGVTYEGVVGVLGHTANTPTMAERRRLEEAGILTDEKHDAAHAAWYGRKPEGRLYADPKTALLDSSGTTGALEKNQVSSYVRERIRQGGEFDIDKVEYDDNGRNWTIAIEPGDRIKLDATVKEHKLDTFGGANEKQTVLTRGKMLDYLGTVEVDEKGMPKSLGRRGRNKLALPFTVQEYNGRWGRAYIPLPERWPGTPITFKRRIRERYYSGFEVEYTDGNGNLDTIRVEDAEVDIPIDMLAKRADIADLIRSSLAKHGSGDQSPHGNWARNMSGRQLADEAQAPGFEGFSVHHPSGARPTTGYAFSPYPQAERPLPLDQITAATINAYRREFADLLAQPDTYLGAWLDPATNQVFLDVSVVLDDLNEATARATAANQYAIWDLSADQQIDLDTQRVAARRVPLVLQ